MKPVKTLLFGSLLALASLSPLVAEAQADDRSTLQDLHWLSGSWLGTGGMGDYEEHWLPPSGGAMIGMFRLGREGGSPVFEYMMITEDAERIVMRFKHFNMDYTTWESDGPLEFTLINLTNEEAVFHSDISNQHRPRRITYRLSDEDSLVTTVESSGEDGRLDEGFSLEYTRH